MNDLPLFIIAITLIILLLLAAVAIVIVIANRQRIKQQASFDKELRTVEQEVQEEMLTRISRELHDNIGQLLTVAHLQMKKNEILHPTLAPQLKPISNTIDDTVTQVKALGKSLNTDLLKDKGLKDNITQEVARIQLLDKFTISWQTDSPPLLLPKDNQLIVFRIFQEIINNTLKYAEATKVEIKLTSHPFRLQIKDNGKGFDLEQEKTKGMGLQNIEKRTKLANLTADITTSIGKGCIFTIYQSV